MMHSCSSESETQKIIEDIGTVSDPKNDERLELSMKSTKSYKIVNGVKFEFKAITALEFLNRNGKVPSQEDLESLKKEIVLIFEIQDTNSFNSIFEHPSIVFSQDETVQYLTGQLLQDLTIQQDDKRFDASGIQYEGIIGANTNKIRVLTFFNGVDLERDYHIHYNDPIFEAGLIRIKKKTKHLPV